MVLLTVYIRAIVDTSRIILIMYDVLLGEGGGGGLQYPCVQYAAGLSRIHSQA